MAKKKKQVIKKETKEEIKEEKKDLTVIPVKELGDDYSDQLFATIGALVFFSIALLVFAVAIDDYSFNIYTFLFTVVPVLLGFYFVFVRKKVRKYFYSLTPVMEYDGIKYKWLFGIEKKHSYTQWAASAEKGHYRIGRRGIDFWLGVEKIVFLYNVGVAEERNDSIKRYKMFTDYLVKANPALQYKLPCFSKENIDLLDKRCFYARSRRNQFFVSLAVNFFFLAAYQDKDSFEFYLVFFVCVLAESIMMFVLLKGAYYHYKNELQLRKKLPDITGVVRDKGVGILRPYWGFLYAVLLFAFTYYLQMLIIR